MLERARTWLDRFRGSGDLALTIPALDSVFRPNDRLEKTRMVAVGRVPDNLALCGGTIFFSSGPALLRLDGDSVVPVAEMPAAITAIAAFGQERLAVGLAGGTLAMVDPARAARGVEAVLVRLEGDATALAVDGDAILVAVGSSRNGADAWVRDLMEGNAAGSVWRLRPDTGGLDCLGRGLAYPNGLLARDGVVFVSEAWRHRIVRLGQGGDPKPVVDDLPGYPARLAPGSGGDVLLAVMAPRNQLVEFVLREKTYRLRMMAEIDPRYWVAPILSPVDSFLEPMQESGQRTLGRLKPWAATRSYGLVVRFDRNFSPLESFHSRADGTRHGITSVLQAGDAIYATTHGGRGVIELSQTSVEGA